MVFVAMGPREGAKMEKRIYCVVLSRELVQNARVLVKASSELEAEELALQRAEDGKVAWGEATLTGGDPSVESVEEEVDED